jgi:hypothetical protein
MSRPDDAEHPPPTPRRAERGALDAVPPLWRLAAGRAGELGPAVRAEMVAALSEGDPPMDACVAWMADRPDAHALFGRALRSGIASVPDAPAELRGFFEGIEAVPPWVEPALLDEGARSVHRFGFAALAVLRDVALMGGYLFAGFNHPLVLTGALTKGAGRRLAETSRWWLDCTEIGGMRRGAPGFRSSVQVRLVHALVRRSLAARGDWDAAEHGLPVNQLDMAATALAFGPVMLSGVRALGVPVRGAESRAVVHLWKYVAWLMGVRERWLVDDERAGFALLHQTFAVQSPPDWTSRELATALAAESLDRTIPWLVPYPRLQAWQRKARYEAHLSTSSLFLDRTRRRYLGLPERVWPWFPLLTAGPRFAWYASQDRTPSARRRLERIGRRIQVEMVEARWQATGLTDPRGPAAPRGAG